MELKYLKPKKQEEVNRYTDPDSRVLDTFENPGVNEVTLECIEFTSLCPVTGQPDFGKLKIIYTPKEKCLESKSLKLYLGTYRQFGGFAEKITQKIYWDLFSVLDPIHLRVVSKFSYRGGISIEAYKGD